MTMSSGVLSPMWLMSPYGTALWLVSVALLVVLALVIS